MKIKVKQLQKMIKQLAINANGFEKAEKEGWNPFEDKGSDFWKGYKSALTEVWSCVVEYANIKKEKNDRRVRKNVGE